MPTRLLLDEVTSVAFEEHQRLHTLTPNKIFRLIFLFGPPATPNLSCIASGATLGSFARRTKPSRSMRLFHPALIGCAVSQAEIIC